MHDNNVPDWALEQIKDAKETRTKTLNLSGFRQQKKLTRIPADVFALTQLKELDLHGNQIQSIPADIVRLTNLQILNLSANRLTHIPDAIVKLQHLETVDLSFNRLTHVPSWLVDLPKSRIILDRNPILSDARIPPPSPRRVVQIGDKYYALLRQFNDGHLSVVWQAQPIPDGKQDNPGYFHEIYTSHKELWLALKKQTDIRHEPDKAMKEDLVAIKTPNSSDAIPDIRAEAKNLRQLRGASSRSQRLIELIDDHSHDPDCPCLVLAWAQGTQLDNFSQPMSERDSLSVGFQVAKVIEAVFNLRYTPLNDSIKPNSIFWDEESRRATIIDLGLVGEHMADLETQTLPIFGDTLHRVLTGQHVGTHLSDKGAPIPDQLWADSAKDSWQNLSFGTRQIVQNLFNGAYLPQSTKELKGNDLYNCLSQTVGAVRNALEEQIALWDEPDSQTLLQKARYASYSYAEPAAAINYFDIAWGRGEIPTDEDRQLYAAQWDQLIWEWLKSENHGSANYDISWFCEHLPEHRFGRRAWLANEAALNEEGLDWARVLDFLRLMDEGDHLYGQAVFSEAARIYEVARNLLEQIGSKRLQEIQNEAPQALVYEMYRDLNLDNR